MSKCAEYNYNKFLKCTSKIGLNVNNARHLEFLVSNLIPRNLQLKIFNGFMSTGIFLSNKILIGNLKRHLSNKNSYIKLIFPYLDYGLNYLYPEKNDINMYENIYKKDYFISNIEKGKVFPSFNLDIYSFNKEKNNEKNLWRFENIDLNINSREMISKQNNDTSKLILFI
jgi:hypothetical protein